MEKTTKRFVVRKWRVQETMFRLIEKTADQGFSVFIVQARSVYETRYKDFFGGEEFLNGVGAAWRILDFLNKKYS